MEGKTICALLTGCLSAAAVLADDFWNKNPYMKWTAKQCDALITKSPWAIPYALTSDNTPAPMSRAVISGAPAVSFPKGDAGDHQVHLFLQIRFVTAQAIKAAIGRMRLLANPRHPSLSQEVEGYLNQPPPGQIIVEVTFNSRPAGHSSLRPIEAFFRTNTLEQLRKKIYLSHSKSNTYLELIHYIPPGEGQPGALLFFPRYDESGKPYFDGAEKSILLRLETDFVVVEQEFYPKEMFFKGEFTI